MSSLKFVGQKWRGIQTFRLNLSETLSVAYLATDFLEKKAFYFT